MNHVLYLSTIYFKDSCFVVVVVKYLIQMTKLQPPLGDTNGGRLLNVCKLLVKTLSSILYFSLHVIVFHLTSIFTFFFLFVSCYSRSPEEAWLTTVETRLAAKAAGTETLTLAQFQEAMQVKEVSIFFVNGVIGGGERVNFNKPHFWKGAIGRLFSHRN